MHERVDLLAPNKPLILPVKLMDSWMLLKINRTLDDSKGSFGRKEKKTKVN